MLTKLDQKICVLIDNQSVIWEATYAFVQQRNSLLQLEFVDVGLSLADKLEVCELSAGTRN